MHHDSKSDGPGYLKSTFLRNELNVFPKQFREDFRCSGHADHANFGVAQNYIADDNVPEDTCNCGYPWLDPREWFNRDGVFEYLYYNLCGDDNLAREDSQH